MNLRMLVAGYAGVAFFSYPVAAITATGLSSFEGLEQPAQRYLVATRSFEPEVVQAITDEGGGVFKMALRYNASWWDGDRDTGNRDRGEPR